jgi:hypothetical protein
MNKKLKVFSLACKYGLIPVFCWFSFVATCRIGFILYTTLIIWWMEHTF